MSTKENTVESRALTAWYRSCKREGRIYDHPSPPDVVHDGKGGTLVVLSNVNGELATYRDTGKRLVRVR
jgi:hypothetical protein